MPTNHFEPSIVSCSGVKIGHLLLPPFELRKGDWLSCHLPEGTSQKDVETLVGWLIGRPRVVGLQIKGSVAAAEFRGASMELPWPILPKATVRSRLSELPPETSHAMHQFLAEINVCPDTLISTLQLNVRKLIGLKLALLAKSDAILLDVAGCDPQGCEKIYRLAEDSGSDFGVFEFSHLYHMNNRSVYVDRDKSQVIEILTVDHE